MQSLDKGFVFARVGDKNVTHGHPSSGLSGKTWPVFGKRLQEICWLAFAWIECEKGCRRYGCDDLRGEGVRGRLPQGRTSF